MIGAWQMFVPSYTIMNINTHNRMLIRSKRVWKWKKKQTNPNTIIHVHSTFIFQYVNENDYFGDYGIFSFQMLYSNKMRAYAYDYTYGSVWTISPFPIVNICGKTIEFKCTFSWWFSMQKLLRRCVKCTLRIYRDEIQFNRWIWDRIQNRFYIHRIYILATGVAFWNCVFVLYAVDRGW